MPTRAEKQSVFDTYGFTNDPEPIASVRAFVAAAVADGWSIEATYLPNPRGEGGESVERAARLRRDGFTCQVLMRDQADKDKPYTYRYEAKVSAWGPDGMSIKIPSVYDWAAIQEAVDTCNNCGSHPVKTVRYSFAGRCCEACVPAMRAKYEQGNWTA